MDPSLPPDAELRALRAPLRALLAWRRDVRRFRPDPLAPGALADLLAAAALAPSVGLSQPARFVEVRSRGARAHVRANFAAANARALAGYTGERARLYASLKLSGLDEAPVQLAVFVDADPAQGRRLGRETMPETLAYSAVLSVHTLWLAARVEGVGVGWVSILDPERLAADLQVPPSWRLVAHLCLGYPQAATPTPELETAGWERRRAAPLVVR